MPSVKESKAGLEWSEAATGYDKVTTPITGLAATSLVQLAEKSNPLQNDSLVLDVGAGTGAVAIAVADRNQTCSVLATDVSAKMLDGILAHNLPNVSTKLVDALELEQLGMNKFTHVFSTFVLQSITTPMKVLSGIFHCLQPGGAACIGVWGKRMDTFITWELACQLLDPTYSLDPDQEFDDPDAWRTEKELRYHLEEAGFILEASEEMVMPFPFESADAYVNFWFNSANPLVEEAIATWKGDHEQVKEALRKVIFEQYGDGQDIKVSAALCVAKKP